MTHQPTLERSDRRIDGANATPIGCYGMVYLDVKIPNSVSRQKFYICENDVTPLLGRDFMRANKLVLDLEHDHVYVKRKRIPVYDLQGKVRNRVALIQSLTLRPGEEMQLTAKLEGKSNPENVPCMVEPAKSFFCKTGAIVARTVTIPKSKVCNIRMMNPGTEPVRLWKGMTMGVLHQIEEERPYDTVQGEHTPTSPPV